MSKILRAIDSLKFDPANARKHDERNIKAIMDSLKMHGQRKPVVLYSDMIVAGNGTVAAAKRLGWTEVWVNNDPFESLEAAKAYALQDNRSAELAAWDDVVLGDTLNELKEQGFDMNEIGFNDAELNAILNGGFEPDLPDENENDSEKKITLTVMFDNDSDQQDLFEELRDRGFKVKA